MFRPDNNFTLLLLSVSDQDSYRLPEGVTRVGYDADTGRYTFQERGGRTLRGRPYQEYGVMDPIYPSVPRRDVSNTRKNILNRSAITSLTSLCS